MIELGDLHQRTVLGGMPDADPDAQPDTAHALPEGTRLLDYEIVRLIGEGGFGIVYLAWDRVTKQHVAIKEYLPSVLASRATTSQLVILKSRRHAEHFRSGLRSFMYEARLLARFNHPSLVKVLRFWELNGTAYMAMPYHEGPTLGAVLETLGRPANEQELRGWLTPLLDALRNMHAVSCYHRDISPDNILLTPGGPMLLDFGAARRVIGNIAQAPTVMIKPGFAPIEQYGDVASMKQGPWSDLYALAAVVYAAITGSTPVASISRLAGEHLEPLAELAAGHYSASFLQAVDEALSVFPENRPQSVADFQARMNAEEADEADEPSPDSTPVMASTWVQARPGPSLVPEDRIEADADADADAEVEHGVPPEDFVPEAHHEQLQEQEQEQEQELPASQQQEQPQVQADESQPAPMGGAIDAAEPPPVASVASAKSPRPDSPAAWASPVDAGHSSRFRRKAVPAVAMLVVLAVAVGTSYLAGGPSGPVASVAPDPDPKPMAATPPPSTIAKTDAMPTPKGVPSAAPSTSASTASSNASQAPLRPVSADPPVARAPAAADAAKAASTPSPKAAAIAAPTVAAAAIEGSSRASTPASPIAKGPLATQPSVPIAARPRPGTSTRAERTGGDASAPATVAIARPAKPAEVLPRSNPPLVVASGGERRAKDEARCNDMVQRASLEPISAAHARRLKKECQK